MSVSKLTPHFTSHPVAFGFQASLSPDNIILIFFDFQTGIGVTAHATLNTEHLIFIPELLLLIQLPPYKVLMED